MRKFRAGKLHSGSKTGKKITSKKQAVAVMLSEKRAAEQGRGEYAPKGKPKKLTGQARRV
jgi:hypothetical protein